MLPLITAPFITTVDALKYDIRILLQKEQTDHLLFAIMDSKYVYFLAKVPGSYKRVILRKVCFQIHSLTIIHLFICST